MSPLFTDASQWENSIQQVESAPKKITKLAASHSQGMEAQWLGAVCYYMFKVEPGYFFSNPALLNIL